MGIPHTSNDAADQIPLSFNQEFLCMYDRGDKEGPFGPAYHIVHGWRIEGEVDTDVLQDALNDVVERHEALRTSLAGGEGGRYQEVFPPSAVKLSVRDLSDTEESSREQRSEELLDEVERSAFEAQDLPLLRAVLGRFDDRDFVLVLITHHTATDGWSMRLIMRDLAAFYAARRGHGALDLPEPRQYRDYVLWQRGLADDPAVHASRRYWREKLRGARIFALPTDQPRSAELPQSTSVHRFLIGADLTSAVLKASRTMRSSPFMVLLAALNVLIRNRTGDTDIVVPTFTPGRGGDRFQNTVGSFFNFFPLRTDISGCTTFREVVDRTRRTCAEAYSHDIPQILGEAPELMVPAVQDNTAACVFQVFPFPFLMDGKLIGDLRYSEIRRRLMSQTMSSDIPDGALWTLNLDPSGEMVGTLAFKNNLFEEDTLSSLVSEFRRVLEESLAAPDAPMRLA